MQLPGIIRYLTYTVCILIVSNAYTICTKIAVLSGCSGEDSFRDVLLKATDNKDITTDGTDTPHLKLSCVIVSLCPIAIFHSY